MMEHHDWSVLRASTVAPMLAIAKPIPSFRTSRLSICSPNRRLCCPRESLPFEED